MSHRYPGSQTFDAEPGDDELSVILGPDFAGGVTVTETSESISVAPSRINLKPIIWLVVPLFAVLTSLPWVLPRFGVELPSHIPEAVMIGIIVAIWVLILPTVFAVLVMIDRVSARVGPGLILRRSTDRFELPWLGLDLPRDRVRKIIELSGRRRYAGNVSLIVQWGLLFEDETGRITTAPIAKSTATRIQGDLTRVLQATGLPVRRIKAARVMD